MTMSFVLHDRLTWQHASSWPCQKLYNLSQDELLGLAADPGKGYLADQIDPTVLLRQREDRQVWVCNEYQMCAR